MTQHDIVQKSEKIVKEWIKYAKKEYGWKEDLFELFEEPMIELCTSAVTQSVKDLEKENTELKETLKTYNGCGDWDNDFHACRVYLQHEELQMYIDQLTKAKEIIKDYMIVATGGHITVCSVPEENRCIDVLKLNKQAEQFLNSELQSKWINPVRTTNDNEIK